MKVSEIYKKEISEMKLRLVTSIFDVMKSKNINVLELKRCITINESNDGRFDYDVLKGVNLEKQAVFISSYDYFEQPIIEIDFDKLVNILEEIEEGRYSIEEYIE